MKLGVVMEYLIPAQAKQGKIAEAMKHVDELDSRFKGEWSIVRLKGWVQFEAGKLEDSVKSYNEAIDLLKKADNLTPARQEQQVASLRYVLSGVFVEMNDINKAAEQLQMLLKKKPDYPGYNNDLGYIWADHDMKLDESEKLIRKALDEDRKLRKLDKELTKDEDKDKPEYLDSLGWVLYKQKKFAEAKKPLLEAIKDPDTGQHIEIFDHLADVHMALGEKADAIAVWKKALDLDVSGKRDLKRQQDVLKKIKAAEGK
jgi:Tfp pilus assembly protein PilF